MIKIIEQDTERLIEEVIDIYPEKAKKERKKHLLSNDPECTSSTCQLKSNVKTIPGVMTSRGCAFAGSKGVVWGPIKDMVHISHGPVGCGQYSWWSRRNYYNGKTGIDTFVTMHITSDFQENDIVFGGDKKLEQLCREIKEMFPLAKGITIQCECPVGLIGDDIESVARKMTKELGIPVIPVRCEGFRGISQSLGHHIANDSIRDWVLGKVKGTLEEETPYDVLILGDYNIGGEAWSSRKILEEMGLRVIAQIPGDCTLNELTMLPRPKLILVHCYRSTNYIARYLEENFGIPWIEYNFFGPTKIYESMRKIAKHFDEKKLWKKNRKSNRKIQTSYG